MFRESMVLPRQCRPLELRRELLAGLTLHESERAALIGGPYAMREVLDGCAGKRSLTAT